MIQELTKRGICVSLGKGWGTQGLGELCPHLPWGCGISNSVSVQLGRVEFWMETRDLLQMGTSLDAVSLSWQGPKFVST